MPRLLTLLNTVVRRKPATMAPRRSPTIEAIEARMLFSADAPVLAAAAITAITDPSAASPAPVESDTASPTHGEAAAAALRTAGPVLHVIDSRAEGADELAARLLDEARNGAALQVMIVEPQDDGWQQIGEALRTGYQRGGSIGESFATLHLVPGGHTQAVSLGNATLDLGSLRQNAAVIAQWRTQMQAGAVVTIDDTDETRAVHTEVPHALARLSGVSVECSAPPLRQQTPPHMTTAVAPAPRELLVVDARTASQLDTLRQMLGDERSMQALILHDGAPGTEQIADYLALRGRFDTIRIVTHGSAGSLQLGAQRLGITPDGDRPDDFVAWRPYLADDADLLFYGCDVAANTSGQALLTRIAEWTGADVAASDDLTGANASGGNWRLEYQVGTIAAPDITNVAAAQAFVGTLADNVVIVDSAGDGNDTLVGGNAGRDVAWLNANGAAGGITLREALLAANNSSNTTVIRFDIAGTGAHTIALTSPLPAINRPVVIDATGDDSFLANGSRPAIIVQGFGSTATLQLAAGSDGSTVRGLVVRAGAHVNGSALLVASNDNVIVGNYLGDVDDSGNELASAVSRAGSASVVRLTGANNQLGGPAAGERNVIGVATTANWPFAIVQIAGAGASGNVVQGNYIGVNAAGTTAFALSQGFIGVFVDSASNNLIDGNIISGAASSLIKGQAIRINDASGNTISNNRIGLTPDGAAVLGQIGGIALAHANTGNRIVDNWIVNSTTTAIWLNASSANLVQGNRIGTNALGDANWGVGEYGIRIESGDDNRVGGTGAGQGNVIAFSGQAGAQRSGIRIDAGRGNSLLGNAIYGSSGLAIDLNGDGPTANDPLDSDSGPNDRQNFPVIESASSDGSRIQVTGSLTGAPQATLRVELFSAAAPDGDGRAPARHYLGHLLINTDANGVAHFSIILGAAVPVGHVIGATATQADAAQSTFGSTSELSTATTVSDALLHRLPASITVAEDTTTPPLGIELHAPIATSLTTSLSVAQGTLRIDLSAGAIVANGANDSRSVTITGTPTQIRHALHSLRYVGDADFFGADRVTVVSTDDQGLIAADTLTLIIVPINDAPKLAGSHPMPDPVTGEPSASGVRVADLLGARVTDVDGPGAGIAIIDADQTLGRWEFSIDDGVTWTPIGRPTSNDARLIDARSLLRFVLTTTPDQSDQTSIEFVAWDKSAGVASGSFDTSERGASSALSSASALAVMRIVVQVASTPLTPSPRPEPALLVPTPSAGTSNASQSASNAADKSSDVDKSNGKSSDASESGRVSTTSASASAPAEAAAPAGAGGLSQRQADRAAERGVADAARSGQANSALAQVQAQAAAAAQWATDGVDLTRSRADTRRLLDILRADPSRLSEALVSTANGYREFALSSETRSDSPPLAEDEGAGHYRAVVGGAEAGGLILTITLIVWASRAGALVGAMWSAVPAWRTFDALVLLSRDDNLDQDRRHAHCDDEESAMAAMLTGIDLHEDDLDEDDRDAMDEVAQHDMTDGIAQASATAVHR